MDDNFSSWVPLAVGGSFLLMAAACAAVACCRRLRVEEKGPQFLTSVKVDEVDDLTRGLLANAADLDLAEAGQLALVAIPAARAIQAKSAGPATAPRAPSAPATPAVAFADGFVPMVLTSERSAASRLSEVALDAVPTSKPSPSLVAATEASDGYIAVVLGADRWSGAPWSDEGFSAAPLGKPREGGEKRHDSGRDVPLPRFRRARVGADRFFAEALASDGFVRVPPGHDRDPPLASGCRTMVGPAAGAQEVLELRTFVKPRRDGFSVLPKGGDRWAGAPWNPEGFKSLPLGSERAKHERNPSPPPPPPPIYNSIAVGQDRFLVRDLKARKPYTIIPYGMDRDPLGSGDGPGLLPLGGDRWRGSPWAPEGFDTSLLGAERKPRGPGPDARPRNEPGYAVLVCGVDRDIVGALAQGGYLLCDLGADREA